ncbi:MAG: hypothetical protein K8T10_03765 [Candidatus Eremiobacteraeota bacterium]|nr:hypothetical protein [Candidatus Eremiobacteraeota bacterium]
MSLPLEKYDFEKICESIPLLSSEEIETLSILLDKELMSDLEERMSDIEQGKNLISSFPGNEFVEVLLWIGRDRASYEQKIEMIKKAGKDKAFLQEIKEIEED